MPRSKLLPLCLCFALAACASASPEDAQMSNALCNQGKSLLSSGKTTDARDIYASATQRDADNARAWNGLGVANDLLGKKDEAQDAYRHALDLAPGDMTALNNLGHLYLTSGDPEDAVQLLEAYANDSGAPPALRQNYAAAKKAAAAREAAVETYADLGASPTEGMAQAHISEVQELLGDDAQGLTFTVVPDVQVAGGTPVFTARASGKPPQDICDMLNPKAFPCVPHGK
jgi:tetratricopeptide (TPR) repeat protein